jgi:hypothetical protein
MTSLHNGHVLQWIRWQHWHAERERRFFAMLVWATNHGIEAGEGGGAAC